MRNAIATATGSFSALLLMQSAILPYPQIMKESGRVKNELAGSSRELVVLLHGIMRSPRSMGAIQRRLESGGYDVLNFGYPSTSEPIETIAGMLDAKLRGLPKKKGRTIHFVTHSMGSIIVRYYLAHYKTRGLGRVVMIAPPNRGSFLATYLMSWPPYRWFFGEAGQQLARSPDALPNTLPPPKCEFGVIAGGLGKKRGFNPFIPGDNDMTVAVEETRLEGMKDFILIRSQHSMLLYNNKVIENIAAFLKDGKFITTKK
ncbi:MAG TPA: alpha/beta hydrolase [Spirochaetes bacterium]|nr:alpha/beta hydrolase [Spirochaetota bacterium]